VHFKRLPTLRLASAASAVYSARIEGSRVDFNAFMRSKEHSGGTGGSDLEWVEALERAYEFARSRVPSRENVMQAHAILTEHSPTLTDAEKGAFRTGAMVVTSGGIIEYMAVEGKHVEAEMDGFFDALQALRRRDLGVEASFYHAALLHLVLAKIHPLGDGNGRIARLLEKWFLAEQRGTKAWKVPTEEFYWKNQQRYYDAINVGPNFYLLDLRQVPPFLALLPEALRLGRRQARALRRQHEQATRLSARSNPSGGPPPGFAAMRRAYVVAR
jgi:Fic family protein